MVVVGSRNAGISAGGGEGEGDCRLGTGFVCGALGAFATDSSESESEEESDDESDEDSEEDSCTTTGFTTTGFCTTSSSEDELSDEEELEMEARLLRLRTRFRGALTWSGAMGEEEKVDRAKNLISFCHEQQSSGDSW